MLESQFRAKTAYLIMLAGVLLAGCNNIPPTPKLLQLSTDTATPIPATTGVPTRTPLPSVTPQPTATGIPPTDTLSAAAAGTRAAQLAMQGATGTAVAMVNSPSATVGSSPGSPIPPSATSALLGLTPQIRLTPLPTQAK